MRWGQLAGAILIALCVGGSWALPLQAQVNEEEPGRQAETEQQQAEPSPLPVRIIDGAVQIIEEDAEAEARQARQQRAEQREEDALVTQRALEDANRRIAEAAEWQTWIIGIGTLAIVATLVLTFVTNKTARDAVKVTQAMGQAQVRAYISWGGSRIGIKLSDGKNTSGFIFIPMVKNTGRSPAHITALYSDIFITKGEYPTVEFDLIGCECNTNLGGGDEFDMVEQWITIDNAISVFQQEAKCYLLGWGTYRTVFSRPRGDDYVFTFCFEISFRIFPEMITKDRLNHILLTSRPNYRIAPKQ